MKHQLKARSVVGSVAAGVLLAAAGLLGTPSASDAHPQPLSVALRSTASGECSPDYLDADAREGPKDVPSLGILASILFGYDRFAGLGAQEFLSRYYDPSANGGKGSWRYPPNDGYAPGPDGKPIEFQIQLPVGQEIDRFGSEFGAFLAPEETPYGQRALPPQNLDVSDPAYPCNYHLYRVVKTLTVEAGPVAPAFGQSGLGLQFQVVSSLLPGAPATVSVKWLVDNGYLTRATPPTPTQEPTANAAPAPQTAPTGANGVTFVPTLLIVLAAAVVIVIGTAIAVTQVGGGSSGR